MAAASNDGGIAVSVEIRNPAFRAIVGDSVDIETLGTGFDFTEGPVWHSGDGTLVFSDMPGNRMRVWHADTGIRTFRHPSNMANGNAYDRAGRLVTCEHATSRVVRANPDGGIEVLASRFRGRELNSPNDVIVAGDGSILFTDPGFGRMEYYGVPREPELPFRGVYRISAGGGEPELLFDDFDQPNGLCLSLDERTLWINDTMGGHIRAFDVSDEGTIGNGRVWAAVEGEGDGVPDGMKIDSEQNLYCTGPGPGIHVFDPEARCLGVIRLPEPVANFCWGDADMKSLFVTASTSLYRIRTRTPGICAPL